MWIPNYSREPLIQNTTRLNTLRFSTPTCDRRLSTPIRLSPPVRDDRLSTSIHADVLLTPMKFFHEHCSTLFFFLLLQHFFLLQLH
ncbi:hypothetical protein HanIR_Chr04g0201751 [Helianthus annuus]|nr:hypothetical protein HanIR_Chr04g0201751 [Helianthus annuus]